MYKQKTLFPISYSTCLFLIYDELSDKEKEANKQIGLSNMKQNFSGNTYHNVFVKEFHHCEKNTQPNRININSYEYFYTCVCPFCKREFVAEIEDVKSGHKLSCGCKYNNHSDEVDYPRFQELFHDMNTKCNNSNHSSYKYYGAKGIKISPEWNSFEQFKSDMFESYKAHVDQYGQKNTVLARLDRTKDFSKSNCVFMTREEAGSLTGQINYYTYRGNQYTLGQLTSLFADSSFDNTRFRDKMRKSKFYDKETKSINDPSIFVDNVTRSTMNLSNPIKTIYDPNKVKYYQEQMKNLPKFN